MRYTRWVIGVVVVIVILILGTATWLRSHRASNKPTTYTVTTGSLDATVEFTGHLQAQQSAKLGFESTGVARQVKVGVGDSVTAGQTLATLDTNVGELEVAQADANLASAMATAQAGLASAQSTLTTTQTTNAKTIAQAQQTVRNAKQDVDQAQKVWEQTVRESGDESSITQSKYSLVVSAKDAYTAAQAALKTAQATADKTEAAAQAAVTTAQVTLANTQQAAIHQPGLSALAAADQLARVRLSKNTLVAPFAGVVTEKNINTGELAIAGTPLLTIQTTNDLEVVADVAETDATKLAVGQTADFTLDAYEPTDIWHAEITHINPAATVLQGVPTYQVTLRLEQVDPKLRPGLTANVTAHTQHRDNVIQIPRRAVIHDQNKEYVDVQTTDGTTKRTAITTGLVGATGQIEVTSGLTAGQVIVMPSSATS